MRIVALLTVRNEARYLARCLQHLHGQGVETCLIDHGSDDETLAIAESYLERGVMRIEHLPFTGVFSLEDQLRQKEALATEIDADWFIHQDADEIRQAPPPFRTLAQGIAAVDRQGWNAIDFDEFVFVPVTDEESFAGRDYVAEMRDYYYYEPESPDRFRINAWKKQARVDLVTHAGHQVLFPGRRVCPQAFILRHYMFLSRAHAAAKYGNRRFAEAERARDWHSDRVSASAPLSWPERSDLTRLDATGASTLDAIFDTSRPWRRHFWVEGSKPGQEEPAPAIAAPAQTAGDAGRQRRLGGLLAFKTSQGDAIPAIAPATEEGRPFWSVMIPTFNPQPDYLVETLTGLLALAPDSDVMQIEVVDDASTTVDVAALVSACGGSRVSFYRQASNVGLVANWNTCVQRAHGEWVHLLHQDDRVLPGFYARLHSPCATLPGLTAAYCRGAGIDDVGQVRWVQEPERESPGILADLTARLAAEQRILTPSIVVKRRSYEEIGGYHTGLLYCADWDMYKRLAVLGPVWYEPAALACWRQHEGSASARIRLDGADLADRRRSIQLSQAYLPASATSGAGASGLRGAILWALDTIRTSLLNDDLGTALAQTREIARTLEDLTASGAPSAPDRSAPAAGEHMKLWAEIDRLEAEVQAWRMAAQQLAANRHSPAGLERW